LDFNYAQGKGDRRKLPKMGCRPWDWTKRLVKLWFFGRGTGSHKSKIRTDRKRKRIDQQRHRTGPGLIRSEVQSPVRSHLMIRQPSNINRMIRKNVRKRGLHV